MTSIEGSSDTTGTPAADHPVSNQTSANDDTKLDGLDNVSSTAMAKAIIDSAHPPILPPLTSEGAKSLARRFRHKSGQESNAFRQSKFLGKGILHMTVLQALADYDPDASFETRTMYAHAIGHDDVLFAIAKVNGLEPLSDTPSSKEVLANEIRARLWLLFAVAPPFFEPPDYEVGFGILEPWVAGLISPEYIAAAKDQNLDAVREDSSVERSPAIQETSLA